MYVILVAIGERIDLVDIQVLLVKCHDSSMTRIMSALTLEASKQNMNYCFNDVSGVFVSTRATCKIVRLASRVA